MVGLSSKIGQGEEWQDHRRQESQGFFPERLVLQDVGSQSHILAVRVAGVGWGPRKESEGILVLFLWRMGWVFA